MSVEHIYKRNWRSLFVSYDFCVVASVAFWQNKTKKALAIFHAHCYLSRKEGPVFRTVGNTFLLFENY